LRDHTAMKRIVIALNNAMLQVGIYLGFLLVLGIVWLYIAAQAKDTAGFGSILDKEKVGHQQAVSLLYQERGKNELARKKYTRAMAWFAGAQAMQPEHSSSDALIFLINQVKEQVLAQWKRKISREILLGEILKAPGERAVSDDFFITQGYGIDEKMVVTSSGLPLARLRCGNRVAGEQPERVQSAVFSPDGTSILLTSGQYFSLFNAQGEKNAKIFNWIAPKVENIYHTAELAETVAGIFSSDGRYIFTADEVGIIRKWDSDTRKLIGMMHNADQWEPFRFLTEYRNIFSCQADESSFLLTMEKTIGSSGEVMLWDAEHFQPLQSLGETSGHTAAFSRDCESLVVSGSQQLQLYRKTMTPDGKRFEPSAAYQFDGDDHLLGMVFSDDNRYLICAYASGKWLVFDLTEENQQTPKQFTNDRDFMHSPFAGLIPRKMFTRWLGPEKKTPEKEYLSLKCNGRFSPQSFSPDGKKVIVTRDNGASYEIFDIHSRTREQILRGSKKIIDAAFDSSGKYVFFIDDSFFQVWDSSTGTLLHKERLKTRPKAMLFSQERRFCFVLATEPNYDWPSPILIFDGVHFKVVDTFKNLPETGNEPVLKASAVLSPQDKYAISVEQNNWGSVINLFSFDDGSSKAIFPGGITVTKGHTSVVASVPWFSADGKRFITGMDDGCVDIWEGDNPDDIAADHFCTGSNREITVACYNEDGTRILTLDSEGMAKVWDAAQNHRLLFRIGDDYLVRKATYIPGRNLIAAMGVDNTVHIYDGSNGDELKVFYSVKVDGNYRLPRFVFSADSRKMAIVSSGTSRAVTQTTILSLPGDVDGPELEKFLDCYVPWEIRDDFLQPVVPHPSRCRKD